jgi:class 3 adenylate cyclase
MVRVCTNAGGDVFKFAGDAMIVMWTTPEGDDSKQALSQLVHQVRVMCVSECAVLCVCVCV